jgi:SpoVK/Ycf46/Vps4 family AAA+-type ATPase
VNGVLLHGPPGTGKTYSAKALAGELGINVLPMKISDISEIVEGAVRSAINDAAGRQPTITPSHVFDRVEALAEKRDQDTGPDLFAERPEITFDHVAGREELKSELRSNIVEPHRNPGQFEEFGLGTINGVPLCGPPGAGKTYLSKALAGELGYNYIELSTSEVTSKWIGGVEENVRELFETAREVQPCIILLDELDSIAPDRDGNQMHQSQKQVVNELLNQLTEIQGKDIVVIGTTNLVEGIDDAMTRAGRLDERIDVEPSDRETQLKVLRYHLTDRPLADDIDWERVESRLGTDDTGAPYVAADLEAIADEAARNAMSVAMKDGRERHIRQTHITDAIADATSSLRK